MDEWLVRNLVCPRDKKQLELVNGALVCASGHSYQVVDDIPVMLLDDVRQTIGVARASMKIASTPSSRGADTYFLDSLGISEDEKRALTEDAKHPSSIDPVVKFIVGATSGFLYKPLIGRLDTYPIPELRLPSAHGELFLDVGCNWGRWCIAAARKGYTPVGIDPSIGAIMAARRVSAALGVKAMYVVADARYLPFSPECFDVVFSYSVLQHFSKDDARKTFAEIAGVLRKGGVSLIQMPNAYGLRSFQHQARRRFKEAQGFEVRYWRPSELKHAFESSIGNSSLFVDGYFGLGVQKNDIRLLPFKYRIIVRTSEILRKLSLKLRGMVYVADSVYVKSNKSGSPGSRGESRDILC